MQEIEEPEKEETKTEEQEYENHLQVVVKLEEEKIKYKIISRPLVWYRNIVIIDLIGFILAIGAFGIWGENAYIGSWSSIVAWFFGLFMLVLIIHFFNLLYKVRDSFGYVGDEFGFGGIERIKALIDLKDQIARLETVKRILEQ